MAWTAPRTWVVGEIPTAAIFNQHWRDQLLETAPAKAVAAGDIFYATAANAIARLPIGTTGQLLRVNSGATAPEWFTTGVTILSRSTSQVDVVNTTTETSIFSYSIAGNELGTTGGVWCMVGGDYLNNSGAGRTLTLRAKLGATTALTSTALSISASGDRRKWFMLVWFIMSSASAQKWNSFIYLSAATADNWVFSTADSAGGGQGTSAENTATAKTFDLTVQHSAANASLSMRKEEAILIEV